MNETPQTARIPRTTPRWLRNGLLILLIGSAAAGLIFSVFAFHQGAAALSSALKQPFTASAPHPLTRARIRTDEWNRLFDQIELDPQQETSGHIVCQGMLVGENGRAVAAVNNQVAMPGSIINGAQIRSISTSNIVVEYNGQLFRLGAGDTLKINRENTRPAPSPGE